MRRRVAQVLTLVGLLAIASTTLIPIPRQAAAVQLTSLWCLVCGDFGGVDVVNNLLLFIPFAAGLRLLGFPVRTAVAVGALLSLTIETLQFFFIVGRDASLSDVLTNTTSSCIGAVIGNYPTQLFKPSGRQAVRLAALAAMIWIMVQVGTAALLRPWSPAAELRAAWRRSVPGKALFDGQVRSAFVSGTAASDGTYLDSELDQDIRERRIRLELAITTGHEPETWSPIFELVGPLGALLAVEAIHRDVAFQPPARSYSLRLRRPALRLVGVLSQPPGTPVELAAGIRADTLWAKWSEGTTEHREQQVLSPSLGWSLVTPWRYAYDGTVHWITGLWIAGWLVPVGYWAGRARLGPRAIWFLGLVLVVGLGLVARAMGYPGVHWSEWLAGILGGGIGWASHYFAAYLEARCDSPFINGSC